MRQTSNMAGASMHRFLALVVLQARQGLHLQRWLLIPVVFTLFAFYIKDFAGFDWANRMPIEINLWDLLPSMLVHQKVTLWAYVLGFTLLIGDGLARARASGAATLALVRAPSRTTWWISRGVSIGFQAGFFVAASTAVVLVYGALALPLSLGPSPGAQLLTREAMLYPRPVTWPMPVFTLAIMARATLGLWLLGCALELVALLSRRPLAPLLVVMGAIFATLGLLPGVSRATAPRWVDPTQLISYADRLAPASLPVGTFLLAWLGAMLALVSLGAWRLRHLDL